ncbi:MAG: 50S ribosomal protein L29 [bacterium]|nr:50S ribosomal protein L29 [bacterium]
MKMEELRKLSTEELNNKIKENKEELFNLRFQQATGNLEKPVRLRELRKQVAKMKTIIRERELEKVEE